MAGFLKSDKGCRTTGLFLLVITVALQVAARTQIEFATWYSSHVYLTLMETVGRFFGAIPFPVAEPALYGLFLLLLVYAFRYWGKPMGQKAKNLFYIVLPMSFLVYTFNGGINYYADPYINLSGGQSETYSQEELKTLCLFLIDQINETSISESYQQNRREWKLEGLDSMNQLGEQFPELGGFYPLPKDIINSRFMSAQQMSGLYTPFTMEIYINSEIPDFNIPHTICHELFHSKGYMREDEANFFGYLACIASERQAFRYSGYLTGWIYAGNALAETDPELYRELSKQLKPQVRADLENHNLFWSSRKGILSELSNQWRDTYLKVNNQPDGIHSYDGMVELMLAYYKNEE